VEAGTPEGLQVPLMLQLPLPALVLTAAWLVPAASSVNRKASSKNSGAFSTASSGARRRAMGAGTSFGLGINRARYDLFFITWFSHFTVSIPKFPIFIERLFWSEILRIQPEPIRILYRDYYSTRLRDSTEGET